MTQEEAVTFAARWIDSWNCHDLDAVLKDYDEDVEWSSSGTYPGACAEKIRGLDQVRNRWKKALLQNDSCRFELIDVLTGDSSVTICYKAENDKFLADVLFFNEQGKIARAVTMSNELS